MSPKNGSGPQNNVIGANFLFLLLVETAVEINLMQNSKAIGSAHLTDSMHKIETCCESIRSKCFHIVSYDSRTKHIATYGVSDQVRSDVS